MLTNHSHGNLSFQAEKVSPENSIQSLDMTAADQCSSPKNSLVSWFLSFTSVGGLTQIGKSSEALFKLIWSALFIAGIVLTTYNTNNVYQDYAAEKVIQDNFKNKFIYLWCRLICTCVVIFFKFSM